MSSDVVRAARLRYIEKLLLEDAYTIRELAALCEMSRDTIYRDLVDLQLPPLCCPIFVEQDRWRIAKPDI